MVQLLENVDQDHACGGEGGGAMQFPAAFDMGVPMRPAAGSELGLAASSEYLYYI
jgi:hypothetical protein